mmetsp:Transcript_63442/g.100266  ORF Transcript_63442/g.100266 Transcript_63442/m.100266 type:complete len:128 (+) Transcript_63442:17-400(+)
MASRTCEVQLLKEELKAVRMQATQAEAFHARCLQDVEEATAELLKWRSRYVESQKIGHGKEAEASSELEQAQAGLEEQTTRIGAAMAAALEEREVRRKELTVQREEMAQHLLDLKVIFAETFAQTNN